MADTVTVTAPITYIAWEVPTTAALDMPPAPRQEGIKPRPTVKVEDLADNALDALAGQWLMHLYASVGRDSPFTKGRANV